eukprot:jgi/Hompol1/6028/HPOL_002354-RA
MIRTRTGSPARAVSKQPSTSEAREVGESGEGKSLALAMKNAAAFMRTIAQHRTALAADEKNNVAPASLFAPAQQQTHTAVHVRVRPLSQYELSHGFFSVFASFPAQTVLYHPSFRVTTPDVSCLCILPSCSWPHGAWRCLALLTHVMMFPSLALTPFQPSLDVHSFPFDGNFGPDTDNDTVFEHCCNGMMDFVVSNNGLASIFAYGQTSESYLVLISRSSHLSYTSVSRLTHFAHYFPLLSVLLSDSGKTYTMSAISERLTAQLPFETHTVTISMFEILGNDVRDLNARAESTAPLMIFLDNTGSTVVHGATNIAVADVSEASQVIKAGFEARATRGTFKNDTSSRSHLVCCIKLESIQTPGEVAEIRLVDLAGSERAGDRKNHDAVRTKEAALINSSLMALKGCIRKLNGFSNDTSYVPFRHSKLTMLLKDSLDSQNGRPTKTAMIACMSPSVADLAHTLSTYRYASTLKSLDSNDDASHGAHLKPTELSESAAEAAAGSTTSTAKKSTSPLAWSTNKLENWIFTQTHNQVELKDLLGKDGDRHLVPPHIFVPPPALFIYGLEAEEWVKRTKSKIDREEAISVRNRFRKLFLTPRAVGPNDLGNRAKVDSIMVDEDSVTTAPGIDSASKASMADRQAAAMAKLKAKGDAARAKAEAARNASSSSVFLRK